MIPLIIAIIAVAALLAGCDAESSSPASGSSEKSDSSVKVVEDKRKAISLDEIVAKSGEQTDLQWKKYVEELEADYETDGWKLKVSDVHEALFGGYYITASKTGERFEEIEVEKTLSEEEALKFNKGDSVVISGPITGATRFEGHHTIQVGEG